jgi:hypothetical protein
MATESPRIDAPSGATDAEPWRLYPDGDFSRNVRFHFVLDTEGVRQWVGSRLDDLIVYAEIECPQGLVVEIEGIWYLVRVSIAPKDHHNGKDHSPPA